MTPVRPLVLVATAIGLVQVLSLATAVIYLLVPMFTGRLGDALLYACGFLLLYYVMEEGPARWVAARVRREVTVEPEVPVERGPLSSLPPVTAAQRRASLEVFDRLDPGRAERIRRMDPVPDPAAPPRPCGCTVPTDRVEVMTFEQAHPVSVLCEVCGGPVGEAAWAEWKAFVGFTATDRLEAVLAEFVHVTRDGVGWDDTDLLWLRRLLTEARLLRQLAGAPPDALAPMWRIADAAGVALERPPPPSPPPPPVYLGLVPGESYVARQERLRRRIAPDDA